jgi:hypothetical protein
MLPAYFSRNDMPKTGKEKLPVYEVEELEVERRMLPGKFYAKKDGALYEHERRKHVEGVELPPARKRSKPAARRR